MIGPQNTYSFVSLDQLFDTLDAPTRQGLRGFIQGEAASIEGKALEANQTLRYFAPALSSTSNVTAELTRDEPAFDGLLVQGAQALQTAGLAQPGADPADREHERDDGGDREPEPGAGAGADAAARRRCNHSTSTFAGLRQTLDALDAARRRLDPASRHLKEFAAALRHPDQHRSRRSGARTT